MSSKKGAAGGRFGAFEELYGAVRLEKGAARGWLRSVAQQYGAVE